VEPLVAEGVPTVAAITELVCLIVVPLSTVIPAVPEIAVNAGAHLPCSFKNAFTLPLGLISGPLVISPSFSNLAK
jgi:hypothetical protein